MGGKDGCQVGDVEAGTGWEERGRRKGYWRSGRWRKIVNIGSERRGRERRASCEWERWMPGLRHRDEDRLGGKRRGGE